LEGGYTDLMLRVCKHLKLDLKLISALYVLTLPENLNEDASISSELRKRKFYLKDRR